MQWIVVGSLFPFLIHGESIAHFEHASMVHHTLFLAVPMGISAWVIARTLRRPRPLGILVQIALGALAFILAFLVVAVVVYALVMTQ